MSLRITNCITEVARCRHRQVINDKPHVCQRVRGHEGDHYEYYLGLSWPNRKRKNVTHVSLGMGAPLPRHKSLVRMNKEELTARVLELEQYLTVLYGQAREQHHELERLRALRDSIKVIDLGREPSVGADGEIRRG